jgi:hypothetical protein
MNRRELEAWCCFNEEKLLFLSVWKCEAFLFTFVTISTDSLVLKLVYIHWMLSIITRNNRVLFIWT